MGVGQGKTIEESYDSILKTSYKFTCNSLDALSTSEDIFFGKRTKFSAVLYVSPEFCNLRSTCNVEPSCVF